MPSELVVQADRVGGLHFVVHAREHDIHIDYSLDPQIGAKDGATPLETLLGALVVCSSDTVNLLLQRQEMSVAVVRTTATGTRRDEHPTVLTHIDLEFTLEGDDSNPGAVDAVLEIARTKICPVWVMLGAAAEIRASYSFSNTRK